ncbi:MAG: DUF2147 domain-containing protein [Chitinophagales bacterium]|nr:DUF2147 domain-containing protein [Bacteroidota bacterium]MCB9043755.1 DUF2147 domain-containing protein [Chitinophagales bacterium]
MRIYLLLIAAFFTLGVQAQSSVLGKWKTIDDETNKPKSIVEVYEENGKVYGKILKLFRGPDEDQDPDCTKCTDDRKNQRIIGMQIIRDMKNHGDYWDDGTIVDPKNGKVYSCQLTLKNDNELDVRGYLGFSFIGRSQTWIRVKE